jgi:hypothetical protein
MKQLSSIAVALLLASPLASHATTGNELHSYCQGETTPLCSGIVGGTVHGYALAEMVHEQQIKRTLCLPSGVANQQLIDIVKSYLKANPSKRHQDAYLLILLAAVEAYPCK